MPARGGSGDSQESSPGWVQRLLHPRSVAIVGASARPGTLSAQALANLRRFGYAGKIFPVNPKYTEFDGLACHPSLSAVPDPVDLALILVPAAAALAAVEECAEAGVGTAVIFSSGFAELGAEGKVLQDRMSATVRARGLRLLGPNCQGLIYRPSSLVATFSEAASGGLGTSSGVAYVGQSGAVGGSFLGMARERGIGLTAWASTGNQSDLTVAELATGFIEEDAVQVVAMYLEALPPGDQWLRLTARASSLGKDLVVLRSGRSAAGRRAAASHTGAMIGPDAAFDLVSAQQGVLSVDDVDQLLDTVVELVPRKQVTGRSVAVITSSGGAGSIAADQLAAAGLETRELGTETQRALAQWIPPYGSTSNPVDVTAQLFAQDGEAVAHVCQMILADEGTDAVIVIMTNVTGSRAARVARQIVAACDGASIPLGVVWLADGEQIADAVDVLREHQVPLHDSITRKARVLARLHDRYLARCEPVSPARSHDGHDRGELRRVLADLGDAAGVITEARGGALLDEIGVARPSSILVNGAEHAATAAAEIGGPVVLKVQSAQITHKTDVGGVRVGVEVADAAEAYSEVINSVRAAQPNASIDGVLVQRLVAPGVELLVGIEGERDGYPPIVTVGMGGVSAEIYRDVVSALAPLTEQQAVRLLDRLRAAPILDGHRGRPGFDKASAAAAVSALSRAAARLGPALAELEINPLIVHASGVSAADLVLRIKG